MESETVQIVLSPATSTLYVIVGILISLLLPLAVRTLKSAKLESMRGSPLEARIASAWNKYGGNRYLMILFAMVVIAIVLVFLLGLEFTSPRDAALAGFAWESLVNKLYSSASES